MEIRKSELPPLVLDSLRVALNGRELAREHFESITLAPDVPAYRWWYEARSGNRRTRNEAPIVGDHTIRIIGQDRTESYSNLDRLTDYFRALRDVSHEHVTPILAIDRYGDELIVRGKSPGTPNPKSFEPLRELDLRTADDLLGNPLDNPTDFRPLYKAAYFAQALAALHARGLFHPSLVPSSIRPVNGTWGLFDAGPLHYGSSKRWIEQLPARERAFLAPELLTGSDPDRRTDIYSLGAFLLELSSGRPLEEPVDSTLRKLEADGNPICRHPIYGNILAFTSSDPAGRPETAGVAFDSLMRTTKMAEYGMSSTPEPYYRKAAEVAQEERIRWDRIDRDTEEDVRAKVAQELCELRGQETVHLKSGGLRKTARVRLKSEALDENRKLKAQKRLGHLERVELDAALEFSAGYGGALSDVDPEMLEDLCRRAGLNPFETDAVLAKARGQTLEQVAGRHGKTLQRAYQVREEGENKTRKYLGLPPRRKKPRKKSARTPMSRKKSASGLN